MCIRDSTWLAHALHLQRRLSLALLSAAGRERGIINTVRNALSFNVAVLPVRLFSKKLVHLSVYSTGFETNLGAGLNFNSIRCLLGSIVPVLDT